VTSSSDRLPLVFLVDYDGTICLTQVTDILMEAHVDHDRWQALDERYLRGEIGSREELAQLVAWLPPEREPVAATAAAQPHDRTFVDFVALTRELGVEVEIVSDGYGFYVEPALEALGVSGLPISTASTSWESGRPRITFPLGHPSCFLCGTCKRERVLHHRGRGAHVVLVGDGTSDRFAAAHADTVFAKAPLSQWCDAAGWPYERWSTFDDVSGWLRRVAVDPGSLRPGAERGFICGPEVWGPGGTPPPAAV
jgi:HAD superfamily phosphoserine phosphatase-like hydrolase